MITVSRLSGAEFGLNPDLIERIHESPDTTIVTVEGARYIVRESKAEVIGLIRDFRASVLIRALALHSAPETHTSGK